MLLKAIKFASLALLLCSLPALVQAQVSREAAEDLMHRSGLWEQLGAVQQQLDAMSTALAERNAARISPEQRERLTQTLKTAFNPDHLRLVATSVFAKEINAGELQNISTWYNSEVGALITQAETQSANAGRGPRDIMTAGEEAFAHASPERQKLVKQLLEVSRAAEATTSIVINTGLAVQEGFRSVQSIDNGPSISEVRTALEKKRPLMLQGYSRMLIASFSLTYASISDEILEKYIGFLSSSPGAHFTSVSLIALDASFTEAAKDFGGGIPSTKPSANS